MCLNVLSASAPRGVPAVQGGQSVSDPLELDFWMVVFWCREIEPSSPQETQVLTTSLAAP